MTVIGVLRRHKGFRALWVASVLSECGSTFSMIALPLYVLDDIHSLAVAGLIATLGLIGAIAIRIPAGIIADRWPHRQALLTGALVGAFGMLLVVIGVLGMFNFRLWVIGLGWTVTGFAWAAVSVIQNAAVRQSLPQEDLQTGLSAWQAQYAAITLVGPLLGGLAYSISHALPFIIDTGSFVVEVLILSGIQGSLGGGQQSDVSAEQLLKGLLVTTRSQFLRVYAVTNALVNVASQGMLYGMMFMLARYGGISVGASFSILAAGSFMGTLVIAPRLKTSNYRRLLAVYVGAYALAGFVGFLTPGAWPVVVALSVAALVCQPSGIVLSTHVLTSVPEVMLGRVQGALFFIGSLLYPFGSAVTGVVANTWSLKDSFVVWSLVCCLPFLAMVMPAWRLPPGGNDLADLHS